MCTIYLFSLQAIMDTAFTRVVLPMPIFVLPPIIMSYLERYVLHNRVTNIINCNILYYITQSSFSKIQNSVYSTACLGVNLVTYLVCLLTFVFLCVSFRLPFLQSNRRLLLPIHSLVCLATFSLSLPLAISLFPQMSQV